MKKKKVREKIRVTLSTALLSISILMFPISIKEPVEPELARALLFETYKPLNTFVCDLSLTDNPDRLRLPDYVKSCDDFVDLFDGKMNSRTAKEFYEDWIMEDENGLYADSHVYIPSIYTSEPEIMKSYIRTRVEFGQWIIGKTGNSEVEWIIKVNRTRTNGFPVTTCTYYFDETEEKNWVFDHYNGGGRTNFVEPEHNIWYEKWQS